MSKEQQSLFDNIFIEQAEYIESTDFTKWNATHPNESNIIKKLTQAGAKIITGPRGCGKTTLMIKAYNAMLESNTKPLPVYVNFKLSLKLEPLYHKGMNATYWFKQWLVLKIYLGLIETLEKAPKINYNDIIPYIISKEKINSTLELIEKDNVTAIGNADTISIERFEDSIKNILSYINQKHCVVLLDDAAHAFSPEQQKDFFDFFREIKSKYISPKAAIYPGITVYSSSFHAGHDAEEIDVWLKPQDKGYFDFMNSLLQNRLSLEDYALISSNENLKKILIFSCFGIPRALMNTLQLIFDNEITTTKYNYRKVTDSIKKSYERTEKIYKSLTDKLPIYKNFIECGEDIFQNMVEGIKTYNKAKQADKQAVSVAIKHPISKEIDKILGFLQYAGLVMYDKKLNKGENGKFDVYIVHYGALIERNAFLSKYSISSDDLSTSLSCRDLHEYKRMSLSSIAGDVNLSEKLIFSLPSCEACGTPRTSDKSKFCSNCGAQLKTSSLYYDLVNKDIDVLSLTHQRVSNIKSQSSIKTIKDLLMDNGGKELRKVTMIGEVWSKRIITMAEEYLE